jgi:hypothetical protein
MRVARNAAQQPLAADDVPPPLRRSVRRSVSHTARLVYDLYGLTAEEIALVEGQE